MSTPMVRDLDLVNALFAERPFLHALVESGEVKKQRVSRIDESMLDWKSGTYDKSDPENAWRPYKGIILDSKGVELVRLWEKYHSKQTWWERLVGVGSSWYHSTLREAFYYLYDKALLNSVGYFVTVETDGTLTLYKVPSDNLSLWLHEIDKARGAEAKRQIQAELADAEA